MMRSSTSDIAQPDTLLSTAVAFNAAIYDLKIF